MELIQAIIRRKLVSKVNNSILGHNAEKIFRENIIIKEKLQNFFNKNISSIEKIHGKKTDSLILFKDNSFISIQNKKIKEIKGRGLSVDRRPIEKCFNPNTNDLLSKLCLTKNITNEEKFLLERNLNQQDIQQFINQVFLGKILPPQYFIFMETSNLYTFQLYLIESKKLIDYLCNNINLEVKKTCLHFNQNIYLQRKGGKDKKKYDIQTKFIVDEKIINLCEKI